MAADPDARRFAPATRRNREAILAVLERVVPDGAAVLEIASGSGEHAIFLAEHLPIASWQPSDPDADSRASVDAWVKELGASKVRPAIELDVTRRPWPIARADVIVCINMIHISPWSACESLLAGAAEVLGPGGVLYLYGPYRRRGAHTAASNEAFDASLRARNPAWGVRDLEAVAEEARRHGFSALDTGASQAGHTEQTGDIIEMPANNLSVVLRRPSA